MYYVYADGNLIYNQFDRSLTIHSPKVTLELGKAGSFQFDIPPTNQYYNSLTQLKTIIKVELDNKVVFYGRIFSITRNFNNIKHVYCEGALSYLIDTIQQAKSYKGKAKQLFRDIISAHNSLMAGDTEINKAFVIDRLEIEDTDVVIPGKKDKDGKYYGDEYEQTIIESIAEEWLTTYDYINNVLIEYLGGYLIYEYDSANDRNKISYISEDSFDQLIEDYTKNSRNAPEIDYGVNMLDLTEELNAEDLFTVLIPLGDEGLTIEKATNKNDYSDVRIDMVDGKPIGIAHKSSVEKYGRIVKSYVFDNVNEPNTLFTNGYKYLKAHKNIPISFTIKAVDMHFVDSAQSTIDIGQIAKINSVPHDLVQYLICTKIEYDLEDASKNQYTFGNPRQSMTERYKKNKEKAKRDSNKRSRSTSGKALATAAYVAQAYADEVNENYATIKTWVEDHYAGIEEAVHFVSGNGEGLVRATKWVDEYSANAEEIIQWHGKYSESAVETIKWANDYSAGVREAISWYNKNNVSVIENTRWVDAYKAYTTNVIAWYNQNASSVVSATAFTNAYKAYTTNVVAWYNKNAKSVVEATAFTNAYKAYTTNVVAWYNKNAKSVVEATAFTDAYKAYTTNVVAWYNKNASSVVSATAFTNAYKAYTTNVVAWYNKNAKSVVEATAFTNAYKAYTTNVVAWYNQNASSVVSATAFTNAYKAYTTNVVAWYNKNAKSVVEATAFTDAYKAYTTNVVAWYNKNAKSVVEATAFTDAYKAYTTNVVAWYNQNASSVVSATAFTNAYKAYTTNVVAWYNKNAKSVVEATAFTDAYKAYTTNVVAWYNKNAKSVVEATAFTNAYKAYTTNVVAWYNQNASSVVSATAFTNAYKAYTTNVVAWYNKNAKSTIESVEWVSDYKAYASKVIEWYSKNAKSTIENVQWVTDNKSTFSTIASWKKDAVKSIAGIEATAAAAYAMAGLFASYNDNKASITLTTDNATSLIELCAKKVNAENVSKFVLKGFSAEGGKVQIGNAAMSLGINLIQTVDDGAYILAKKIYRGTSAKDDNLVLSRAQIKNLVVGSNVSSNKKIVDSDYIQDELKGSDYKTFAEWMVKSVLHNQNVQMKNVTFNSIKLFKNSATTWSLEDYIKSVVNSYVDHDFVKKKLVNNSSMTLTTYLTNIVVKGIEDDEKEIKCGKLYIKQDGKDKNITTYISDKIKKHKHNISEGSITVKPNAGAPWGLHTHNVTINGTTYTASATAALGPTPATQAKWRAINENTVSTGEAITT